MKIAAILLASTALTFGTQPAHGGIFPSRSKTKPKAPEQSALDRYVASASAERAQEHGVDEALGLGRAVARAAPQAIDLLSGEGLVKSFQGLLVPPLLADGDGGNYWRRSLEAD